jgi:hypothetical protein
MLLKLIKKIILYGGKRTMPKEPQGIVSHIMGGQHKGNMKGKLLGKKKGNDVTEDAVENILGD